MSRFSSRRGHNQVSVWRSALIATSAMFVIFLLVATGLVPSPLAGFSAGQPTVVFAQPLASSTDTPTATATVVPTDTPQPTATPTPVPPDLTLQSPSTGQGPVNTYVTVVGSNFPGASTQIYASSQNNCQAQQGLLATSSAISGGQLPPTTFIWPTSLGEGTYYICATGMTGSAPVFTVLSNNPPSLTLSTTVDPINQPVTIRGTNFLGLPGTGTLVLMIQTTGYQAYLPSVTVAADGSFSLQWTPQLTIGSSAQFIGSDTLQVTSSPEGNAAPALQATASLTLQAASASTPVVTPTVPSSNGAPPTTPTTSQTPTALLVGVFALLAVVLLGVLGWLVYVLLKNRQRQVPPPGYPPMMVPPGTGNDGQAGVPYDPYSGQGVYHGMPGTAWPDLTPPTDNNAPRMGGVAQWGDTDNIPADEWLKRAPSVPGGNYPGAGQVPQQNDLPPQDPWGTGYPAGWGGPGPTGPRYPRTPTGPGGPRQRDWPGAANPDADDENTRPGQ